MLRRHDVKLLEIPHEKLVLHLSTRADEYEASARKHAEQASALTAEADAMPHNEERKRTEENALGARRRAVAGMKRAELLPRRHAVARAGSGAPAHARGGHRA
jgi:hypothetical protein